MNQHVYICFKADGKEYPAVLRADNSIAYTIEGVTKYIDRLSCSVRFPVFSTI